MIKEGIVCWFNDKMKYGFIEYNDNEGKKDIFCHYSNIDMPGFKTLKKGQRVKFSIGINYFGKPKAINVLPV